MMLSRWRRCTVHGDSEILVGEVPLLSPMRMSKTTKDERHTARSRCPPKPYMKV